MLYEVITHLESYPKHCHGHSHLQHMLRNYLILIYLMRWVLGLAGWFSKQYAPFDFFIILSRSFYKVNYQLYFTKKAHIISVYTNCSMWRIKCRVKLKYLKSTKQFFAFSQEYYLQLLLQIKTFGGYVFLDIFLFLL